MVHLLIMVDMHTKFVKIYSMASLSTIYNPFTYTEPKQCYYISSAMHCIGVMIAKSSEHILK